MYAYTYTLMTKINIRGLNSIHFSIKLNTYTRLKISIILVSILIKIKVFNIIIETISIPSKNFIAYIYIYIATDSDHHSLAAPPDHHMSAALPDHQMSVAPPDHLLVWYSPMNSREIQAGHQDYQILELAVKKNSIFFNWESFFYFFFQN